MTRSVVVQHPSVPEKPSAATLQVDLRTFFLGGIFILLLLTAARTASEIVIPVILAFVLKLVLQPVQRLLEKFHIPRSLAAGMILLMLAACFIGLGTALATPAASWGEKLSDAYPQMKQRLNFLRQPVAETQKMLVKADDIAKGVGPKVQPVVMQGTRLSDRIFDSTQAFATGIFTTMLMLFFLLAAGDTFLRRLVEVLPRFQDKRQAVDISQQIEQDLSRYLLTITAMNAGVGLFTAMVMRAFGVEDPLLWGMLAFLLNYVPILGPLIGIFMFLTVGLLMIDTLWVAFLPAVCYLIIHFIESSVVTPLLLARRFTLNPVLVILSLGFWYWMWGVPGAILAMPMLAITKIICDRIERLAAFGHFLEG